MAARILVIADSAEAGQRLLELLDVAGYEAALDDGAPHPADLLVVDVTRLRGAPLAGLRSARERGLAAPALLVAARLSEEMAADVFRLGVRGFLLKPVDPDALGAAIAEHLAVASGAVDTGALRRQLDTANEALRRRLEEQRSVAAVGRAVTQVRDLDAALARIVEAATFLAEAEEGGLFLWEPKTNELVLRAARGLGQTEGQGLRLRVADTIAGECFRTGKPVLRRRAGGQAGLKVKTGLLVEALINVPLRYGDRRIGVLGVYNRGGERGFEDRHLEVLLALADWAAVAIENARMISGLEAAVAERSEALSRALDGGTPPAEELRRSALDFRDPITAVLGEAEALLAAAYGPLEPIQAESVTRIRRRATELLARLDALTAATAPNAPGQPEGRAVRQARLCDIARDVAEIMERAASAKGLKINVDVSDDLPPLPVRADPIRLRQILLAMLNASLHYTEQGGLTITAYQMRVSGGQADSPLRLPPQLRLADGEWRALAVADTGRGYPEEALPALWGEAPFGAHMTLAAPLEITLPQARQLARELGGELWVENTRGAGAVYTLALPLA